MRPKQIRDLEAMETRNPRQEARLQFLRDQQQRMQQGPQGQPLQPAPQGPMREPMPMPRGGMQPVTWNSQSPMQRGSNPYDVTIPSQQNPQMADRMYQSPTMNQGVTGYLTQAPGIERSGYNSGISSPLQQSQGVSGYLTQAPGIERSGYDSGMMTPLQQSRGISGYPTRMPNYMKARRIGRRPVANG